MSILLINPYVTLMEWLPFGDGEAGQLAYSSTGQGWNEDYDTGFPASQISASQAGNYTHTSHTSYNFLIFIYDLWFSYLTQLYFTVLISCALQNNSEKFFIGVFMQSAPRKVLTKLLTRLDKKTPKPNYNVFKGAYLSANQIWQSHLITHSCEGKLVTKKIIAAHIVCAQARELHA